MAEQQPSLHVDTDWKKQAQEEKRKLAEQEAKKAAAPSAASAAGGGGGGGAAPAAPGAGAPPRTASGRERDLPQASFAGLVQSLMTQVLFYLGELAPRGGEPQINLDMAKYNIDMLGMLEDKTRGNLSDEERKLLDTALYETRMRYMNIASRFATI
jgi:hypothetical protein